MIGGIFKFLQPCLIRVVPLLFAVMFTACRSAPPSAAAVTTMLQSTGSIDKYGGVHFEMSSGEFLKSGFSVADIAVLSFADKSITIPVVKSYRHVKAGNAALVASDDPQRRLFATIFYGDFAEKYAIADKRSDGHSISWQPHDEVLFPLAVTIRLTDKGGYAEQLALFDLPQRSINRSDYPHLSDCDFANFRALNAPGIATGMFFRSSSPFNPELGRETYVDTAARNTGIKTIFNMVDNSEDAARFPNFKTAYCATVPTIFRPMNVDVTSRQYLDAVCDGIRFLTAHEPPYLIHCKEGQDRTGFLCAILELWTGATLDSAIDDYMRTFANYYCVTRNMKQYNIIAGNILRTLSTAFGTYVTDITDLRTAAETYLLRTGLTHEELSAFSKKIGNKLHSATK